MDYRDLSEELCQLHVQYARELNQLGNALSSRGEGGVLLWLSEYEGDAYSGDVAKQFGLTAGRVANIMHSLESKGLITRERDVDDARRVFVHLTEEGVQAAHAFRAKLKAAYQGLLKQLGEETAVECVTVLSKVLAVAATEPVHDPVIEE